MTHIDGLTMDWLTTAWMRARTTDHSISLLDESTHLIVTVTAKGGVVIHPDEQSRDDWLYRKAEW